MKIFPSRQPFVVSDQGTSCQIRFSSPSRLRSVVITRGINARPLGREQVRTPATEGMRVLLVFLQKKRMEPDLWGGY